MCGPTAQKKINEGLKKAGIKIENKKGKNNRKRHNQEHTNIQEEVVSNLSEVKAKLQNLSEVYNSGKGKNKKQRRRGNDDFVNFLETKSSNKAKNSNLIDLKNVVPIEEYSKDSKDFEKAVKGSLSSAEIFNSKVNQLSVEVEELANRAHTIKNLPNQTKNSIDINKYMLANEVKTHAVSAKTIKMGNIKINENSIRLDSHDTIDIDGESFTAGDLLYFVEFMKTAKNHCGENLSECRIITKRQYDQEKKTMNEISMNMKKLSEHSKYR